MSVKKFLNQRAVNISVGGQYTLGNWFDPQGKPRTFACRTSRVSPFRMIVSVPVLGKVGDRISAYFGDFGKLEGHISDTASGSFLLELEMSAPSREKFATKLTWLEKKQKDPSVRDGRKQKRIVPETAHQHVTEIIHHAVRQSWIVSRCEFRRPLGFPEFQQRIDVLIKGLGSRICDSVVAVLDLPQGSPCVSAGAGAHRMEEGIPIGGKVHIDINVVIDAVAVIGALDLLGDEMGRRKFIQKESKPVWRREDVLKVEFAPVQPLGVAGKGTHGLMLIPGIANEPRVAGKIAAAGSQFVVKYPISASLGV